jgi:hypothetical protein
MSIRCRLTLLDRHGVYEASSCFQEVFTFDDMMHIVGTTNFWVEDDVALTDTPRA